MNAKPFLPIFIFGITALFLDSKAVYAIGDSYDPCVIKAAQGESIQAAVDLAETRAAAGTQCAIWIGAGVFNENIRIGSAQSRLKNLLVSGASRDKTIINGTIEIDFELTAETPIDGGVVTVKNLTLDGLGNIGYGLHIWRYYVRAESLRVKNFKYGGIFVENRSWLELDRSIIEYNRDGVLTLTGGKERLFLVNNTFVQNSRGAAFLYTANGDPSGRLVNNIYYQNGKGIYGGSESDIFMEYNAFYENGTDYNIIPVGDLNTNLFGADPMFVDPLARDYRLTKESPMRNAGDPASPFDPDNTRADIGAIPLIRLPMLIRAHLRKIHATTSYDLPVVLGGALTTEPRQGGLETLILGFDENVESASIAASPSAGTVSAEAHGDELWVTFQEPPEDGCFNLKFGGIGNEFQTVRVAALEGDSSGDGKVDQIDLNYVKSFLLQTISNVRSARADIDLNSAVNIVDMSTVKKNFGESLVCSEQ